MFVFRNLECALLILVVKHWYRPRVPISISLVIFPILLTHFFNKHPTHKLQVAHQFLKALMSQSRALHGAKEGALAESGHFIFFFSELVFDTCFFLFSCHEKNSKMRSFLQNSLGELL